MMGGSRFLLPFGIGLCLALSPLAAQTREATIEGAASATPVPRVSPALAASLAQAISREIKPHWKAPQGSDADHLVTVLAWELNPDGSLKAKPIVVSQSGITDRNSTLAATHAARAIEAVERAAPFELPADHYNTWKRINSWRFDRRL